MAKSLREIHNEEYDAIKATMTIEKARFIKLLREHHECTWRRVAEDYSFVFHGGHDDDQQTGRMLCAVAADFLGEDWD